MPTPEGFHHVTLSVTDLERSVEWYERVLGMTKVADRSGQGWVRALMRSPSGMVLGLTRHDATSATGRFDHTRVGLDHVSIACRDRAGVEAWAAHLAGLDVAHSGLVDTPAASLVVCRDPDDIPIEFFAST